MKKVTIITPTIGTQFVTHAIESVKTQTYKNIQHLVVVDGEEYKRKFEELNVKKYDNLDIMVLPRNTGRDRYNGHRIYGMGIYISEGEYVCFLDEDNWFDPHHIESLLDSIYSNCWAFSLRKIVDKEGKFLCNDDCESLGNYPSILNENDFFVDMNCYFLPKLIALQLSPIFHRKFREPGQLEIDRALNVTMINNNLPGNCSGEYSVNYRVGNTALSVSSEFFEKGNIIMNSKYNGSFPWRKDV